MKNPKELLRELPKVDDMMRQLSQEMPGVAPMVLKRVVQEQIDLHRRAILAGELDSISQKQIAAATATEIQRAMQNHLRGVINATGVILHTNLGRARLSSQTMEVLSAAATGYSNLEYNLESGKRGSRYEHVEELLLQITGAEAALVVNNNAAAVYLVLDTIAKGTEVIVSRGELVEIGGSFRIPSIMERSGCKLVEVGTTNKTHPADYLHAATEQTGALLKVHTSNYRIIGFTEDVPLSALYEIGQQKNVPVIYDLGSGLFAHLEEYGIHGEPTVAQCVPYADVLTFSGDKLLGGPQAGIIVGRKEMIDRMKKNHLLRALRIDKLTLAALEHTLRQYLDPEKALQSIPTLRMITQPQEQMIERAQQLIQKLDEKKGFVYQVVETYSQIGGGSLPELDLPSAALSIQSERMSANMIETKLRKGTPSVIARVAQDMVLLDMRTVDEYEIDELAGCINRI